MVEAPPELQGVTKGTYCTHLPGWAGWLAGCKANTSGAAGKIHVGWGSLGGVALRLNCGLCNASHLTQREDNLKFQKEIEYLGTCLSIQVDFVSYTYIKICVCLICAY